MGVGNFIENYRERQGYVKLSQQLAGEMGHIYSLVATFLAKDQMNLLEWQKFQGKAEDFLQLKNKLFNGGEKPKEEYIGMNGYAKFADQHYQGNMKKTFENVSAVLDKREMNLLGWQKPQGATEDLRPVKEQAF